MNKKVLFLDITSICNLRCKHCYNSRYFFLKEDSFDLNNFLKKIDKYEIYRIHILGGEPLLSKDLFSVLNYAQRKKIYVSINTNGLLLSRDMYQKLSKYDNLDQITISLDGGTKQYNDAIRGEGVFLKVVNNLLACLKVHSHIKINISCVATDENLEGIRAFKDFPVKVNCLMISTLFNQGNAKKNCNRKVFHVHDFLIVLSDLIKYLKMKGIILQIDLFPIAILWLSVFTGQEFINENQNQVDCISSKLFYSATNEMYVCNPSSFFGSQYKINVDEKTIPLIKKTKCKQKCFFNNQCLLCCLKDNAQINVCEYIINVVENEFMNLYDMIIEKSNNYIITDFNGDLFFVSFIDKIKYKLCKNRGVDAYLISDVYDSCLPREQLLYKTIIAALFKSNKIKVCRRTL